MARIAWNPGRASEALRIHRRADALVEVMRHETLLALACAALGACATQRQATDSVAMAGTAMGEAAAQPLKDLNLIQDPIPTQLKAVIADPYKKPERIDCAGLEHEVRSLDLALGPDIDLPAQEKSVTTEGSEAVARVAANAVKDAASDLIPFRSVVRRLTGAEKNASQMRAALHAGDVRRAYLKGLGLERGCAYPAAPAPGKPGPGPGPGPVEAQVQPATAVPATDPPAATPVSAGTPGA